MNKVIQMKWDIEKLIVAYLEGDHADEWNAMFKLINDIQKIYRKNGWKPPHSRIACPDCGNRYMLKDFI